MTRTADQQIRNNDLTGAAEFVWGAIVHAMSAADPDHETQLPDRFGNPHTAPATRTAFHAAGLRINSQSFGTDAIADCLATGQRQLHNHFYHLRLSPRQLASHIAIGKYYKQLLIGIAQG